MRNAGASWFLVNLLSLPLLTSCAASSAAENSPSTDGGATDAGSSKGGRDAAGTGDAASHPAGGYTVQGATILDSAGKPHLFRGLDRPSLEFNSAGDQLSEGDYQVMAAWGANVVRLSLNQDFWLQTDGSGNANPSYDSSYQDTVDQQVQWAEKHGLDVILDLHWSDKGDFNVPMQCKNASSGCQQMMADPHSVLFWQQVATKYKGDPRVLFELYNEPSLGGYIAPTTAPPTNLWKAWLSGDTTNAYGFTVVGMQELYNTVRATGAQNLVIVGGLNWAYDLRGIATTPVQGSNILYSTHPYQTDTQDQWGAEFGNLSANYPIIATEFGDRSGSCSTTYASNFIAYANKKASGSNPPNEISWTAWAFYVANNTCTFPTLLANYYQPNAFGMVVESALMTGP